MVGRVPLALVGPSGAGKSTIVTYLMKSYPNCFGFSVSSTTRAKRKLEIEGESYFFLSKSEFKAKIENKEFIEWAEVHGNLYGTLKSSVSAVNSSGKICLLDIDSQGILNLFNSGFEFNRICIVPKDEASVRERLVKRGTETEESLRVRLGNMQKELLVMKSYPEVFCNWVVNDELLKATQHVSQIIEKLYPGLIN